MPFYHRVVVEAIRDETISLSFYQYCCDFSTVVNKETKKYTTIAHLDFHHIIYHVTVRCQYLGRSLLDML